MKNTHYRLLPKFCAVCIGYTTLLTALLACSNPAFQQIGSQILSSTGYVSSSQADGLFNAGGKLTKFQETLTPEQEYYLGRAVSAKLLGRFEPLTKSDLIQYVNKVGLTLARVSDVPETFGGYHFVVVESPEINAMSAPSGFVFVSSGFVRELPSEDALAAVLAHEIAHVNKRHGVNAISNAALFSALADAAKQGISIGASSVSAPVDISALTETFSDSVSGIMDRLLSKGFDRKQEYEADRYAAVLMQRAGYDPNALLRILEILEKRESDEKGGWYATHPDPDDRIEELKEVFTFTQPVESSIRTARFKATMLSSLQ